MRPDLQRRLLKPSPLKGEGLGGGDAGQLVGDCLMEAVWICRDLVVPKPQNAIAFVLQEPTSRGDERLCWPPSISTINRVSWHKIGNIAADRHLATELVSLQFMRTQHLPDPPFRLESVGSRAGAVGGMFFHVSACAAGNITPSQPSPIKGEGSKEGHDARLRPGSNWGAEPYTLVWSALV